MNTLDRLLSGRFLDPDSGQPLTPPTSHIVIGRRLVEDAPEYLRRLDLGPRLALVCDPDTNAVLGQLLAKALASIAQVIPIELSRHPSPDDLTAEALMAKCRHVDALVAVGSGTINDLCKYVAHRLQRPYCVFATAPSMNGYTSANAAITVKGHKCSLPATTARGIFIDLEVMAEAPTRLIRAGLGDSLCRCTAQADWLLSHYLRNTPYRRAPFALLAEDEAALFAESDALVSGDYEALARLVRTLLLSGLGMTLCGGSYPASQGEHLISHYIDMMAPQLPLSFHGEQIGVTTLTMARLYQALLERDRPPLVQPTTITRGDLIALFGKLRGDSCWQAFLTKRLDDTEAERLNGQLLAQWEEIRHSLSQVLIAPTLLHHTLQQTGAPTRPQALHWWPALYRSALRYSREIRDRYTSLDLACDSGLMADFISQCRYDPELQQF